MIQDDVFNIFGPLVDNSDANAIKYTVQAILQL